MIRVLVTISVVLVCAVACMAGFESKKGPTLDYTPEFSLLTAAGVNQIKESRHARFDLRDLELTKADVGFDPPGRPRPHGRQRPLGLLKHRASCCCG